ncbi:hypothetical protein EVAR_34653_1 [Eumeta japonica]|uniref:Reverse transcriptase/retrotransposon-derived protein RNase H-like domain-containing protein n=1 Tax=Eumeta variegata TaxID=151549 RepID=A0A4C1VFI5_EUMVA|nr:hypothetical protein EVAR_34653_1 [Eumeta japonica]
MAFRIATGTVAHTGGIEGFAIDCRSRHNIPRNISRRFLLYKAMNFFPGRVLRRCRMQPEPVARSLTHRPCMRHSIGIIDPFLVDSQNWDRYVRRVKQFIALNDINDELQVATLFTLFEGSVIICYVTFLHLLTELAVEPVRALEASERHPSAAGASADGAVDDGLHGVSGGRAARAQAAGGRGSSGSSAPRAPCVRAGKSGHAPNECPYINFTCDLCDVKGHLRVNYIDVDVCRERSSAKLKLYIVENGGSPLVDRAWIKKLKLAIMDGHNVTESNPIASSLRNESTKVFAEGLGTLKTCIGLHLKYKKSVFVKARMLPLALRTRVERELKSLLREGVISKVERWWGVIHGARLVQCLLRKYKRRRLPGDDGDRDSCRHFGLPPSTFRKNAGWVWNDDCDIAFNKIKRELSSAPTLVHCGPALPLIAAVASSAYGLGAVPAQRAADGRELPVSCASRTLSGAEATMLNSIKKGCILFLVILNNTSSYDREYITTLCGNVSLIDLTTDVRSPAHRPPPVVSSPRSRRADEAKGETKRTAI